MWQWYKLFERLIYSTSKLDAEKEPIQVQLAGLDDAYCPITQAWRAQLYNYKHMMCATVQLQLKSGLLMTNQILEFWYSYDYYDDDYYYCGIGIVVSKIIAKVVSQPHNSWDCNPRSNVHWLWSSMRAKSWENFWQCSHFHAVTCKIFHL